MGLVPWKQMVMGSVAASMVTHRGFITPPKPMQFGLIGIFVFAYFVQFAAWVVYTVIIYPHFLSPFRHLPQPTGNHWLMGQASRIRKEPTGEPHRDWMHTVPNDGIIYYRSIFNAERLLITKPKALSEVLVTNSYQFQKPIQARNYIGQVIGYGLLLAEGEDHRHQRKGLMPAFSFRHIKELFPIFWTKGREAVIAVSAEIENLRGQGPSKAAIASQVPANITVDDDEAIIEVGSWFSRATLDIIGLAGMGKDFSSIADPDGDLARAYQRIFRPRRGEWLFPLLMILLPLPVINVLPLKRNVELREALFVIRNVARELIQSKVARIEKGEKLEEHDILSTAIEAGMLSEESLIDQVMTFLAAGHETTSTALTWASYLLCLHPDVQSRLRKEVRDNLPSPDTGIDITAADIERLPYLNAVCSEVLRYASPVPMAAQREAIYDTMVCGVHVPKDTHLYVMIHATNRDEALWGPDANAFNPERWIKDPAGGAKNNFALETFLHGPRSCIGERFARGEMATLLAGFVGRFEFRIADPALLNEKNLKKTGLVVSRPEHGMWTKVKTVPGW